MYALRNCTWKTVVLSIGFLFCLLPLAGISQVHAEEQKNALTGYYHFFAFPREDAQKANVEMFLGIPYKELLFEASGNMFKAEYQVDLLIKNKGKDIIDRTWKKTVTLSDYTTSRSPEQMERWNYSEILPSGEYDIELTVTDSHSGLSTHGGDKLTLKDYNGDGIYAGDIAYLDELEKTPEGEFALHPNMKSNIMKNAKGFYAFTEIFDRMKGDSLSVDYTIVDDLKEGGSLKSGTIHLARNNALEPFTLNLADMGLTIGRYVLHLQISDGKRSVHAAKPFTVEWAGIPGYIKDIPQAIKEMGYIATSKEEKYLEGLTGSQQLRAFKAYWDSLDTDRSTDISEPMIEYFSRADYAMQHFNTYNTWKDGWKTDRGEIFILYGPPDQVYRYPNASDSNPYEIWEYYNPERNYLFVDRTGMGDYQLQNVQDVEYALSTWARMGISKR